jgi:hypothetical protein
MRLKILFLLSTFVLMAATTQAEVKINGFASIVTGIAIEDETESDTSNGDSAYNERTVDNLQESKVALQWAGDLGEGMRFVGQTMARGNSATGFQLNYDWAYFDFNMGDSAKLKVGRLRIPFYKYSDYLDVGYAYHWITPPTSMYSLSFSNMDGVSYQQNMEAMGMDHSLTVAVGTYQGLLSLGTENVQSSLENLIAINWSATMGDHEFSAAYAQADVYVPANATAGLASIVDTAAALTASTEDRNKVLINGDLGSFVGIGYKGTFGDLSVYSEYSIVKVEDSIFSDTEGGYLGISYNMDDYTYHITYGIRKSTEKSYDVETDKIDLGVATTAAAMGAAAEAASIAAGDNATVAAAAGVTAAGTFIGTYIAGGPSQATFESGTTLNSTARFLGNGDSSTITIGARKDIGMSSALKIELDLYTEDRVQTALASAVSEEKSATTLKFAIETMF